MQGPRARAPKAGIRPARRLLLAALAAAALPADAHHSLAIYDVGETLNFNGVIEELRLQNPHISLTLAVTKAGGTRGKIEFAEGPPASLLTRMGLTEAEVAVGKPIRAIGIPRRDDPTVFFLRAIILADGRRFTFVE